MSLIKCPECGKEISDQAEMCIHCGFNLSKHQQIQEINEEFDRMLEEEITRIQNSEPPTIPQSLDGLIGYGDNEGLRHVCLFVFWNWIHDALSYCRGTFMFVYKCT
ncbi:MAG: zinc ribbon domain-containing protein [Blautia sp.]|jgi:hypothetical protein